MYRNFKMKFEYRYIINEDAVICFAKPCMNEDVISPWRGLYAYKTGFARPKNEILPEYKGIARLKDGDNCDVETAKNIARSKAVRAAFKSYRNYASEIFDYFARELYDFGGSIMTIDKKIADVNEEIEELIAKD